MTWTKLGQEFITDPTMLSLPRGARLLHIEATIWSNMHGTDGAIPSLVLPRISDESDCTRAAETLVAAGLWQADDDSWTLVDFHDNQPSADDVDRQRALSRERQRRQRQHRNGDHSLCDSRYCRSAVTRDGRVTHAVSHDTRTEPNRTDPSRKGEGSGTERPDASGSGPARADARPPAPSRPTNPHAVQMPSVWRARGTA